MKMKAQICALDKKPTMPKNNIPAKINPTHATKNQYLTTIKFASSE